MMRHLAIDYAAELVTDYQRLEALWDSYSPYTRPQKLENPDGGEDLVIPPFTGRCQGLSCHHGQEAQAPEDG